MSTQPTMNLKLHVWRQKDAASAGKLMPYDAEEAYGARAAGRLR